ncbi:FG-GAP repeat protein [Ulvibacter sp. MAR_2010_11]|uniref:FG-GAP-like repeat-containing protein n=1 Tax=Ulvibacter sp. MAR_2010_11 TaxID=1250229 RepID=UPI000C2C29F5|nr:FG-GAP-like repeat-containing protein [Ulvibacter sp. MAR_2010_11]PKA82611.1 FG-GAP repeat protein [Ulvibacter sp. MAR_2010_11]
MKYPSVPFLSGLFCILLWSCDGKKENVEIDQDTPLFTLLEPKNTKLIFKNTSIEKPDRSLGNYDYFYNGSGVAISDFNNDGLADVFMCGNDTTNRFFLNKGDFEFEDLTNKAGFNSSQWSTGVTTVDINNDGYLDIYVCNSGPTLNDDLLKNKLYINNGDLTFTESAAAYGIDDASYSSQAAFFDMDKDGDLDLFVLNHSIFNYGNTERGNSIQDFNQTLLSQTPDVQKKSVNTLYRNEGNGKFTDITAEAGMFKVGFGLGVSITDFDDDGYLDVYVSNDYFIPDFLYINNRDGSFTDRLLAKASHTSFYSMGCDVADFNNDGLVDLVAVDMTPSDHYLNKTLMESMNVELFTYLVDTVKYVPQYMFNTLNVNRGTGNFSEIALMAGVSQTGWSWAPLFLDLDNNTNKDLIVTNGFKKDTKDNDWKISLAKRYKRETGDKSQIYFSHLDSAKSRPLPNFIFENQGNLTFQDKSKDWGFNTASFSNGAAYGDLDNDGDLDMIVNNLESHAFVYRNNTSEKKKNHFIQFELTDGKNTSNVLYSKIKVYSGDITQLVEYSFVRGYLSTMQPLAHFGLGELNSVEKVEIFWPDGTSYIMNDVAIDKKHKIDKQKVSSIATTVEVKSPLFFDITGQSGLDTFIHQENKYNDFQTEILLPHKQSTLGPSVSVGDVNKDGLDDLYIGGALGQAGRMYFYGAKGMEFSAQPALTQDSKFEDTGSLFFDSDGDGDLDLYVSSGGGGDVKNTPNLLQDRLYVNDGQGNLKRAVNALPKITSSTKEVSAFDWDGDGDLDLFVGGRTEPGKYPLAPTSYLLENTNGIFKDVTMTLGSGIHKAGMITGSCWLDMNRDGRKDLVIVGEWTPIMVFHNTPKGFVNATESYSFSNHVGWWSGINKGDFDNDGDEDLIVGNIGLNNKFHPTMDKPLHIFSSDFDKNGTLDIVLSKYYKGKLAPVRGKECSSQQMPFINEKFPMYKDFASSTLEDIYGTDALANALHYAATNFASVYIENLGNGSFAVKELPMESQMGPINDMVVYDFNKDGNLDLLVGGNVYDTEVETPAYDANKGLYMQGNGDGSFKPMPILEESGLFLPLNVKGIEILFLGREKRPAILAVNNAGPPKLLIWTR